MIHLDGSNWYYFALLGLFAGTISGALGVGAGIILVPALVILLGAAQKEAQGTALVVMIAMALMGSIRYYLNPDIKLYFGGIVALSIFAVIGSNIGSSIAFALPGAVLRKIFAVFIIIVGVRMLFK